MFRLFCKAMINDNYYYYFYMILGANTIPESQEASDQSFARLGMQTARFTASKVTAPNNCL